MVEITVDGEVYIGDTSLRKYMSKYTKPMININKITFGWFFYINAILLQSDLNKYRLSQLARFDKLYNNYASTRLLQSYKNNLIE